MSVLDDIVAGVRDDLTARQAVLVEAQLIARVARTGSAARPDAGIPGPRARGDRRGQAALPSKGDLAEIPDPAALAGGLRGRAVPTPSRCSPSSGASAAASRTSARSAGPWTTPLLRKDFMVTGYQVLEARAAGADLVLLIVAALDDALLRDLHDQARELGLTVLTEVHDEAEVERALAVGATLVGVNARNLKTLEVDAGTFARLSRLHARRTSSGWPSPASPAAGRRAVRRRGSRRGPGRARRSCATATRRPRGRADEAGGPVTTDPGGRDQPRARHGRPLRHASAAGSCPRR